MRSAFLPQRFIRSKAGSTKYYYWICFGSNFPTCKSNPLCVLFEHLYSVRLCHIFRNSFVNGTILGEIYLTWNACFVFSTKFILSFFFISGSSKRGIIINGLGFYVICLVLSQEYHQNWIFSKNFNGSHKYKQSKSVHLEQICFTRTDGQEPNSRLSQRRLINLK
jgi:hypothetical protein